MYNPDSKIMRKLLGKAAPDAASGDLASANQPSLPVAYRPTQSQNAVYHAGVPISCLDVAPDRRAVVLGGPHILKTLIVDEPGGSSFSFSDGIDVQAAIRAQKSTGPRSHSMTDQLNISDVKWHGNSTLFTACATGKIFAYDLARLGSGGVDPLGCIQIPEDSRQVNTLDVNPHLQSWLLSGSQDGIARTFDASNPVQGRGGNVTFRQRFGGLKCNDPIRQVKWSPRVGHEMACCMESGVVLKWDARQPNKPMLRINAHEKACSAIAWHPDGTHLITGGQDGKIHVWDIGTYADKRQKPKWSISTPAPVSAVAWRPGLWSASAQSRRAAQVAVTYDDGSNKHYGSSVVHIWDMARPAMPYKEIERFDTFPSALSWQDQDMLWTVGQDGTFNQCDVAFAPKVIDRKSTSATAFSSRGDVVMFLDERHQPPRPRPIKVASHEVIPRSTYPSSPVAQRLSISRSDSEDDVMSSFLSPRRNPNRKRRPSIRSAQHMSTTPPTMSAFDGNKDFLGLRESIDVTGVFKPQQAMASGHVPAAKSVHVYHYLSSVYLETLQRELPFTEGGKSLVERMASIMEQYAKAAEVVNLYRLSQTWRILAYAMTLLLKKRAQYHLETRLSQFQKSPAEGSKDSNRLRLSMLYAGLHGNGEETPRRASGQNSIDGRFQSIRSLLSEEIESTSNVPTPIARPVDGGGTPRYDDRAYQHGRKLTPIIEPSSFDLGPSAHASYKDPPRRRLDSEPISETSLESEQSLYSSTEGYDFYDTEALAMAIDVPYQRKNHGPGAADRPKKGRQDSDESFNQMFSVSSGAKNTVRDAPDGHPGLMRHESDLSRKSEESAAEFESRIRGEAMGVSPRQTQRVQPALRPGQTQRTESPEDLFLISQTTMGTDDSYPSQPSYPSQSDSDATKADGLSQTSPPGIEVDRVPSPTKSLLSPQSDSTPHIVESDYLPWEDDPLYPFPVKANGPKHMFSPASPLDPYTVLMRAMEFESRTSALNISAMVLLLKPLVPECIIDSHQARSILRQHHSRLTGMSLFVEAALLRNLCVQGWPAGLPAWGDNYTAIFMLAQQGVKVGLFCASCRKPREVDPTAGDQAVWTCERCQKIVAPCAVCGHREAELPASVPAEVVDGDAEIEAGRWLSQWWICPGCGHGGHASCLHIWHGALDVESASAANEPSANYSDGACPLDGCGHACLPGKYRGELNASRADDLSRAAMAATSTDRRTSGANSASGSRVSSRAGSRAGSRRGSPRPGNDRSVRSDGNDVPQSKAVGKARETLRGAAGGGTGTGSGTAGVGNSLGSGGGILSSSPGRGGGMGDGRRKSVKFARGSG